MKHWLNLLLAVSLLIVRVAPAAAADDRQVVEAQAKRYWAAEVEMDYRTVYDMSPSEDQSAMAIDNYIKFRKEVGPARFVNAEVGEIVVAGDLAWVHVKYDWSFPLHLDAGSRPAAMWQLWRQADGWHPIPAGDREQWPLLPPSLRPLAEEATLTQRVTGLWQAKVAEDWKGVYAYMPPRYRARIPLEKFLTNKARFVYLNPRVLWVEVTGTEARAMIAVGYKINDPAATKAQPREEKPIEPWVKVDGIWYLNAPPPGEPEAQAAKGQVN